VPEGSSPLQHLNCRIRNRHSTHAITRFCVCGSNLGNERRFPRARNAGHNLQPRILSDRVCVRMTLLLVQMVAGIPRDRDEARLLCQPRAASSRGMLRLYDGLSS